MTGEVHATVQGIDAAEEGQGKNVESDTTELLVKAVHPKLGELPRWKAVAIACWVVTAVLVFLVVMIFYSMIFDCEQKIAMIDANWDMDTDEDSIIAFKPYKGTFEAPTHICMSMTAQYHTLDSGDNKTETVKIYDIPCLLPDLTCNDYGFEGCPDVFLGPGHICGPNENEEPPRCRLFNEPLASVVYAECIGFFGSVGIALAYLVYIQLAAVVLGYCCYRSCCTNREESPNPVLDDMRDFVMAGLGSGNRS